MNHGYYAHTCDVQIKIQINKINVKTDTQQLVPINGKESTN